MSELMPGDLLVAKKQMAAWANSEEKMPRSFWISPGQNALVISSCVVGKTYKLWLLVSETFRVFSCDTQNVDLNWKIFRAVKL